ncbi:MAG: pimeloyl-ACP methyl ester carboxylesterase [Gammaproteobacteria bacterium]|jgi:pimeloyl-ACP methyl ester carboxylesterase
MPFITVNCVELYYEERGSGPVMLWAHGLGQTMKDWDELMSHFEDRYRVIAYDARGHGRSQILDHEDNYSQDLMIEDMLALLDTLEVDKVIVGGHSMGANVALNFAMRHPERCHAVIPVAIGTGSTEPAKWKLYWGKLARLAEEEGIDAYVEGLRETPAWDRALSHPLIGERVTQSESANAPQAIANIIRGIQRKRPSIYELEDKLKALAVPTLVIFSEGDTPVVDCSKYLSKSIPGAKLAEIPASSHWIQLEMPDAFHKVVEEFVRNLGS